MACSSTPTSNHDFPLNLFFSLFSATSSGYTGDLGATVVSQVITPWQGLGLEFLLTFVVVFVVFASVNPYRRSLGNPAMAIGVGLLACTLVGLPLTGASMNPARSLGPAFVKNKWDAHWVSTGPSCCCYSYVSLMIDYEEGYEEVKRLYEKEDCVHEVQ
nr:neurogenic protein big brain-like [Penaeus vannamei]